MANPFYKAMGGAGAQQRGRRNLAPDLLQYMQGFRGDPMRMLQEKVASSGITQEQYDQLHSAAEGIAKRMMGVLPRR